MFSGEIEIWPKEDFLLVLYRNPKYKGDGIEFVNFMESFRHLHSKILGEKPNFLIFTADILQTYCFRNLG